MLCAQVWNERPERSKHKMRAMGSCLLVCSGLLYCMEYLEDNLDEWLGEELEVRLC